MKRNLDPVQLFDFLSKRRQGISLEEIGKGYDMTAHQVSRKLWTIRTSLRNGYMVNVRNIQKVSGLEESQIISLIKDKSIPQMCVNKVRIKEEISSPNIWYASRKGQEFKVIVKGNYYWVNYFLKIRKQDCFLVIN